MGGRQSMSEDKKTLQGRTALVTGAGRGIGRGIAYRLARDGTKVIVADMDANTAAETAQEIVNRGGEALPVELEVGSEVGVNETVRRVRTQVGPITILVNNAGIFRDTPVLGPLHDWEQSLDVNLTGQLLCARAVVPDMIDQHWGRIVNLASMMAKTAFGRDIAYVASKTGVLGLTRSMAIELAPHNICVNALCPGNIMTAMLEEVDAAVTARDGMQQGQFLVERPQQIPLGRLGTPEDVAGVVAFLCSSDGDYVTGQSIHIDGGLYLT
jgi:NAD(P)-dependent dehydrogenase (short-subunit alcohol dehydrogenase family)